MNAFNVIKTQFSVLEIRPLQPQQNQTENFSSKWKFPAILFLIALNIMMVFIFLAIEASNYYELSGSVFYISTGLISIIFYLSLKCQINSVFKLIGDLNHFVFERKIDSLCISKFMV